MPPLHQKLNRSIMGSILCADIGTTSLKAGIIGGLGEVVSFCMQPFVCEDSSFIANCWKDVFLRCAEECLLQCAKKGVFPSIDAVCISGNGKAVSSASEVPCCTPMRWENFRKRTDCCFAERTDAFMEQCAFCRNSA